MRIEIDENRINININIARLRNLSIQYIGGDEATHIFLLYTMRRRIILYVNAETQKIIKVEYNGETREPPITIEI